MMPQTKNQSKRFIHRVRIEDRKRGLYTVNSERYVYLLYTVNVIEGTCDCEAGQRGFRGVQHLGGVCKHLYAARIAHSAHAMPVPAVSGAAGLLAAFGI
jgi:hypothetical protein